MNHRLDSINVSGLGKFFREVGGGVGEGEREIKPGARLQSLIN